MTKRRIIAIIAIVLPGLGIWIALTIRHSLKGVENAYAVWNVADWVIDYMEANDRKWPRDWSDLEKQRAKRDMGRDIRHHQALVDVDFDVNPTELAKASFVVGQKDPPFRVIRHRQEPHWVYEGREPNEMIWYYLHGQYRSTSPSTTSTAPVNADRE